jgi:clan AA aspartic protease (TIGR02281 family)
MGISDHDRYQDSYQENSNQRHNDTGQGGHAFRGDVGPAFDLNLVMFWIVILAAVTFAIMGAQANKSHYRQAGESIEISVGSDRHFRINGAVNDQAAIFLVDTGATITAIPSAMADATQRDNCQSVTVKTANGPAKACRTILDALIVGPYRIPDVPVTIMDRLSEPLLGAEVLQRFKILQTASKMTLTPGQQQAVFVEEANPRRKFWNWQLSLAVSFAAVSVLNFVLWRKSQR